MTTLTYIEEIAYKCHNPTFEDVKPEELGKIPPPLPIPDLPKTGCCKWNFDDETRVMLATFSKSENHDTIHGEDEIFFHKMMERDDLTLITEGLVTVKNMVLTDQLYLEKSVGVTHYHNYRKFERNSTEEMFSETKEDISMTFETFFKYLNHRKKCMMDAEHSRMVELTVENNAKQIKIDVFLTIFYLYDMDLKKYNNFLYENFIENMHYPGILPGKELCMMETVDPDFQPFMGPNVYITPAGSHTQFHQDGHGTVDSGHCCIMGINEVVMLRRLTERHKKHALWLNGYMNNDALYQTPHDPNNKSKMPGWPSKDTVDKWKEMGYCPSVCLVKPGQIIHINKGRLHAFRKQSRDQLPNNDCHFDLREAIQGQKPGDDLCISVAWDWIYRGITAEGINRELISALECTKLNRNSDRKSLGIPELCTLQCAKLAPFFQPFDEEGGDEEEEDEEEEDRISSYYDLCRGLLPSLRYIVTEHREMMDYANDNNIKCDSVSMYDFYQGKPSPDSNREWCKLCYLELSNVYYECNGCIKLSYKRYNICHHCYKEERYRNLTAMNELWGTDDEKDKRMEKHRIMNDCRMNHTGNYKHAANGIDIKECKCKRGICHLCQNCWGCSCQCHFTFTQKYRFFTMSEEEELLKAVENVVKNYKSTENNPYLDDPDYLKNRFHQTTKRPDNLKNK